MITKQVPEQHMEDEVNLWTLESPMTTSKMGSLSASTATSMDTWPRNTDRRRKNAKLGSVSNVKRRGILQKTAKRSR